MKQFCLLILSFLTSTAHAQMSSAAIDSLTLQVMKTFDVPGIAIGVIDKGELVHAKGYGLRSLKNKLPVDEHTLFGIASNSKAFTCVALSMLIDQNKLKWDDKVQQYIPEFSLIDTYAAKHFTIKDLVTHRSGLGLGAGDLMFFPEGGNRKVDEIIKGMQFQQPVGSFRAEYQYNNNFYIIAGEVIRRISGLSWEDFIEQNILYPIGMTESKASFNRVPPSANIIDAHAPVNGKAVAIPHDWSEVANPAGGIMSNIVDMSKWAKVVMNEFELPNGNRLISKARVQELWNIQMPQPVALNGPYNTHFKGYALGWVLTDIDGHFEVSHTGGLIGTVTQFIVYPDQDRAIIILTNQQQGIAFTTLSNSIKDGFFGFGDRKWLDRYADRYRQFQNQVVAIKDSIDQLQSAQKWNKQREDYIIGHYNDAWMGDALIFKQGKNIRMTFNRSPRLTGTIYPLSDTSYVVRWDDRSYDADAIITFHPHPSTGKATTLKMEAYSPSTDFSFDFHHLNLIRLQN